MPRRSRARVTKIKAIRIFYLTRGDGGHRSSSSHGPCIRLTIVRYVWEGGELFPVLRVGLRVNQALARDIVNAVGPFRLER
jgi:hypothetical protein